jgi:hypothetical protein
MPLQTGKNFIVAHKVEGTYNTQPGASGATVLRVKGGGLNLAKTPINSEEIRGDALTAMARHGSQSVAGSYQAELSVDAFDEVLEGVMRSTWVAAVAITQATMTSITTTASTIVAAAGSWLTQGVRVGDIVTLTGHATAANNDLRLRVKTVTASTITVIGTPLTTDASPDTTFTLTVLRKVKNGTTPTKRTFYIDQYNQDIDLSQVFGGCRYTSFKVSGTPDGMAEAEIGVLGASATALASGASPYYTTPTTPTGAPLVFADALIAFGTPGNAADIAILTAVELNLEITAKTEPVVGSSISPDVFDNEVRLSGSFSMLRDDLAKFQGFVDETEYELHILLQEATAVPKACLSFFVPRLKLMGNDAPLGNDGGLIQTVPWTAGVSVGTSSLDTTMLTICTSST